MKLLLAVPSYNRPYDIMKRTGFWLKELSGTTNWKVFVEPQEEIYYSQSLGSENIIETGDDIKLIGQVEHIYKYAKDNGFDLVMKCDDDMLFKQRGSKKQDASKVFTDHIQKIIRFFEENESCGSVNISKPMGYLHWKNDDKFKLSKKPIYGNWITRTENLVNLTKDLLLFDDLLLSIETKKQGKDIYVYYGCYEDAIGEKTTV